MNVDRETQFFSVIPLLPGSPRRAEPAVRVRVVLAEMVHSSSRAQDSFSDSWRPLQYVTLSPSSSTPADSIGLALS